jgi:predicted oxidoreductase
VAGSQVNLAEGGPQFSRLVLGLLRLPSWGLSHTELLDLICTCLELGVTTFDHADVYGNYTCEDIFGRALAEDPSLREKMQLVTKCGAMLVSANRPENTVRHYDTSQRHIITSVENSLKMLRTDRIDLLLIHRPDPLMDADEVAEALIGLKRSGKVLHFGVSNFTPSQFELLASRLDFPLITNQVELSVMNMEALYDGTIDLCQKLRILPMAWSPLGGGHLFRDNTEQAVRLREVLNAVGEMLGGASIDQIALAWILTHPARIIPILGTGRVDRIQKALEATTLKLSRTQWFTIWGAATGGQVP